MTRNIRSFPNTYIYIDIYFIKRASSVLVHVQVESGNHFITHFDSIFVFPYNFQRYINWVVKVLRQHIIVISEVIIIIFLQWFFLHTYTWKNLRINLKKKTKTCAVCPRSNYYIKWVTTSWTYSSALYRQFALVFFQEKLRSFKKLSLHMQEKTQSDLYVFIWQNKCLW